MNKTMLKLVWGMIVAVGMPLVLHAQDQTVSGNLTVTGTADIVGNNFSMGTLTGTSTDPGWQMGYTDGATSSLNFQATRAANVWKWWQNGIGTAQLQMTLDNNNTLTLFNSSGIAEITLNPTGTSTFTNSLTANGSDNQMPNQTLTGTASVLTEGLADARYISNAPSSFSLLPGASATGASSIALGYQASATGTFTAAVGYYASATGPSAIAFGYQATASGTYATALGYNSTASGTFATGLGIGSSASGLFSTAIGPGAIASSQNALACGPNATSTAINSMAFGFTVLASGYQSIALGSYSGAGGTGATSLGCATDAVGSYCTAIGYFSLAQGDYSTAIGNNTSANSYDSTAIGQFNVGNGTSNSWVATDPLLEVGNGSDATHLSDALVVYKNGNANLQGNLTTGGAITASGTVTAPAYMTTSASGDIPMFGH